MTLLKKEEKKVLKPVDFFSLLFHSITQTHIFHLQTNSYAAHQALSGYYKGADDLLDTLIESYQGTNGIQLGYSQMPYSDIKDPCEYFKQLLSAVENNSSLFPESDMKNILDELKTLIKQTLYKLEHLK